jgi:Bacterial capsule synthesis protein PGA_cap
MQSPSTSPASMRACRLAVLLAFALGGVLLTGCQASSGTGSPRRATSTSSRGTDPSAAASSRRHVAKRRRSITIEWVGDIAFGERYGLPPGGLIAALAPMKPYLRDADLTMGNLEGTLSSGGTSKCVSLRSSECYAYQAPPAYAQQLHALGFGVLNQANNHALDFGPVAQRQTLASLAAAHIAVDGLPGQITRLKVHGIRIAVIGFAPYAWANSLLDIPAAQALVARAKREASLVIVIIHAGAEGATEDHVPYGTEYDFGEDRGDSRAFAHAVIDAGASIVLGSGPHVIRGIQRYRGRMIAYSLGDFACWGNLALGGTLSESAILRVTLSPTGDVLGGRWIPLTLVGEGLPRHDPTGASTKLVETLSIEDFGGARYRIHSDGVIDPGSVGKVRDHRPKATNDVRAKPS